VPYTMPKIGLNVKRSIPRKFNFLFNSNISRIVTSQLSEQLNLDFKHISQISEKVLSDEQIIGIAKRNSRIIITHDLDYGEIYYLKEQRKIGVIMLRLVDQTSENVIRILLKFFKERKYGKHDLSKTLTIISEKRVRIFGP